MQQSGLDENGFIISEVSYENILPEYKELIGASIAALKSALPNLIHSIYVYGSVARGDAVREKSDMDLLVISSQKLTETERSTLNKMLADRSSVKWASPIAPMMRCSTRKTNTAGVHT